jgi:hypothetical protein
MRGNHTVLRSSVAVTIAALAVAGCGGQSPPTSGSAGTAGSTAATATASPTASPSPSPTEAAELPSGSMWIEAPKAGIRFPVPDDWRTVSFQEVLDSGDTKAMDEAATMMGVTPDQLQALADQLEVIVFGPTVDKFAVNINAIGQPGTTLPTARLASEQLEKLGGKVGTPVVGTTTFGKSLVVPYSLKLPNGTIQGRSILLETPDGIATLTVSHESKAEADTLTQAILDNVATT